MIIKNEHQQQLKLVKAEFCLQVLVGNIWLFWIIIISWINIAVEIGETVFSQNFLSALLEACMLQIIARQMFPPHRYVLIKN